MEGGLGIAVDLGATRVRACVGTRSGRILRRKSRRMVLTPKVEDYVGQLAAVVREVSKGYDMDDVQGVCFATPGPLDLDEGSIVHTANLPYPVVRVVPSLREEFGDVHLVNDANAGALGEWAWGEGRRRANLTYITISTGLGGGAVVDGRLLLGKEGNAAEIGHLTIDSDGRMECGCGRRGHWEAYCSGTGIPRFARWTGEELRGRRGGRYSGSPLLAGGGPRYAAAVFAGAKRGDPLAVEVLREVGRLNAIGVANVTDAFDPEVVIIGGGVALNNPGAILGPIRRLVADYAINTPPSVKITGLGDDVGLMGALSVCFEPALIGE